MAFNEEEYYSTFKQIRNFFRKYDSASIINGCFKYLYNPTKDKLEEVQKHPWLILLLIKWILLDTHYTKKNRAHITNKKLYSLIQKVLDLAEYTRLPTEYENVTLFFRNMAYQQFIYQHDFSINHLSRQIILFSKLQNNSQIHTDFNKLTGLEISKFLELSMVTAIRFMSTPNSTIPIKWFSSLQTLYSENDVQQFLSAISLPLDSVRQNLKKKDNGKRPSKEYFEQTPFIQFPLIKTKKDYLCVYPNILFRCLENFIYDKLRLYNAESFMRKFGGIFEKYVENTIKYANLNYINESTLQKLLKNKGNLIDFIVKDKNANIFIDAKAVEMSYQGKVAYLPEVVKDKTKSSILKAIEQSHNVIKNLECSNIEHDILQPKKKNYLLVITFKEMYLGNGKTFFDAIAKDKITEIYKKYVNNTNIALEDMHFLTIEEFDIFAELIKSKKVGLVEGLERAKSDDKKSESKKFDFTLHLSSWGEKIKAPLFLSKTATEMLQKFQSVLR